MSCQNSAGKQKVKSSTHPENSRNQTQSDIAAATGTFQQRGLETANHHSYTVMASEILKA